MTTTIATTTTTSKWAILSVVMTGSFMAIMDVSTINVALPSIMTSLRTNVQTITWVVTASMLGAAVTMPATGWLGNRFGLERIYIYALTQFTFGSAFSSFAWNLPSLIMFRVMQATGSGLMQPTGMALMVQYFPLEERGRALGIWGIAAMMAPTLGPTTGGYITDWFGWRAIFWMNVIVGAVLIPLSIQVMGGKKKESNPLPFDWQGYFALAIFLVSFLLGLDEGQQKGWSAAPVLVGCFIAIVAFITFIVTELTVAHPIFPFKILRRRDFTLGICIAITRGVGLFGSNFLIPLFMQKVQYHSAVQTGLTIMPGALMMVIFMPAAGFLTDRIGARIPACIGITLTSFSFYLYYQIDLYSSVWDIISLQMIRGTGVAFLMTPTTTAAMNAVERHMAGTASALINVSQRIGGAFGIAFLATMLERRTVIHLERLSDRLTLIGDAGGIGSELVIMLKKWAYTSGFGGGDALQAARSTVISYVAKSARTRAFGDVFIIAATMILIGLPAALSLSGKTPRKDRAAS